MSLKLSTLTVAKLTIFTRTDVALQTSGKVLKAVAMCSALTRDFGYDNRTINLIGDGFCPKTKCSGKPFLHRKNIQYLGRSHYQCPQCASMCLVRNILLEDETKSFLLSFGRGVFCFEESPKSREDNIGDVYCPGKCCFNRKKCDSLHGYVTARRCFYGCGKSESRLFVQKVSIMLQQ